MSARQQQREYHAEVFRMDDKLTPMKAILLKGIINIGGDHHFRVCEPIKGASDGFSYAGPRTIRSNEIFAANLDRFTIARLADCRYSISILFNPHAVMIP